MEDLKPGEAYCGKCEGTGVSAMRRAIMAPPGSVIVVRDLSQIEARMLVWLCGQEDVVQQFAHKEDVYSLMASIIFSRKVTKADKNQRFIGKVVILGAGYGIGWRTLQARLRVGLLGDKGTVLGEAVAEALNVDVGMFLSSRWNREFVEESLPPGADMYDHALHCACCAKIITVFRDNKPEIPRFWRTCEQALEAMYTGERFYFGKNNLLYTEKNAIILPNGMWLRYPELEQHRAKNGKFDYTYLRDRKKHEWAKAYGGSVTENLIQFLSRIVITNNIIQMFDEGIPVNHTVHDEILSVVKEDSAADVYKRMGEIMNEPPAWAPGLPLDSEGGWNIRYQK